MPLWRPKQLVKIFPKIYTLRHTHTHAAEDIQNRKRLRATYTHTHTPSHIATKSKRDIAASKRGLVVCASIGLVCVRMALHGAIHFSFDSVSPHR